jgi:hypothetical protein
MLNERRHADDGERSDRDAGPDPGLCRAHRGDKLGARYAH